MIIINAKSNQKQAAFNHSSERPFGQKTSHLLVLTISLFLNPIKPWVDVTFCLFCEPCYSWWSNQIFSHTLLLYFSHSSHILVCVWERESVWEPTWMSLYPSWLHTSCPTRSSCLSVTSPLYNHTDCDWVVFIHATLFSTAHSLLTEDSYQWSQHQYGDKLL